MTRTRIEVVAAVLQRDDGSFLLAQRPEGKVYAGYWEFPGGKVEPGESAPAALARELHEELGVEVTRCYPWITRDYEYEHAAVRLRFHRVTGWSGELHGRENQAFAWQHTGRVTASPLLPANGPVLRALSLPTVYGISNASLVGSEVFLERLDRALTLGLRLVQVREKALGEDAATTLTRQTLARARPHGAKVILNSDPEIAVRAGADGVHLSSARLMAATARPDCEVVGASCHDQRELAHAARLGLDFVALGPVAATASHPQAQAMGWTRFAALVADYPLPVYALGGMGAGDLETAWRAGAHGIAAIRGAWAGER
ncbi:MAG TPA: Nudix family hydrolase [Burkholderiales bacterium]|nr:Nudix family hydrolase [Burkholderiales bacterium]